MSIISIGAITFAGFAFQQLQKAERQRVEQLVATAKATLPTDPVEAAVHALAAAGLTQSP